MGKGRGGGVLSRVHDRFGLGIICCVLGGGSGVSASRAAADAHKVDTVPVSVPIWQVVPFREHRRGLVVGGGQCVAKILRSVDCKNAYSTFAGIRDGTKRTTGKKYRFIGLSVFGSMNQAKDHGLRMVQ